MRTVFLIALGLIAVIGGLVAGALLGVVFAGLALGIAGAAVIALVGWSLGRAVRS